MKELAKAVRRDKSTITALVGKLVSHGYVQKESNSADQRSILVRQTPGEKRCNPLSQEISDQLLERIWQGIKEANKRRCIPHSERSNPIWRNFFKQLVDDNLTGGIS
jgi:DNA-binding MarR family transcriptional regulator